jgi:hypothetical protein
VPATIALNELSFDRIATGTPDTVLMERLASTLLSLRSRVSVHDQVNLQIAMPEKIAAMDLPGGTKLLAALQGFDQRDLRTLLLSILTGGPWFDGEGRLGGVPFARLSKTVSANGRPAAALSTAVENQGMCLSLAVRPWQTTPVQVAARRHSIAEEMLDVENLWSNSIQPGHIAILCERVAVLPLYEDPGHHDPQRSEYVHGKSHIPLRAERILQHALPTDDSRTTWWARCEHDFYHRFKGFRGPKDVVVHWNGTTNPRATQPSLATDVPGPLRTRLSLLEPVRGCGCREA